MSVGTRMRSVSGTPSGQGPLSLQWTQARTAADWGIRPDHIVAVWLACSEVNEASGPLRFANGPHQYSFEHVDTHTVENRLSRGQDIGEWGFGPAARRQSEPTPQHWLSL